jgi:RNA polymerase sigma-70 factor (ECF subfamily)
MQRRKPQSDLDRDVPSPERNPEERYETKEMYERVQWAVAELPLDYRRLIILRHFGNLSYREMSGALGIPEKTVKSRLFTARRLLRDTMLKRGLVEA